MSKEMGALNEPVGEFLAALGNASPAPGGGSAAALAVAMAARLIGSVAQISAASWDEAGGARAQAEAIERRIAPLVNLDARRYEEALHALAERSSTPAQERDTQLGEMLERAAEPPLQISEAAADVAELAALAAERGEPASRADALSAAALAEAAAAAAAALVEVNLGTLAGDWRIERVRQLQLRAADARRRAVTALTA